MSWWLVDRRAEEVIVSDSDHCDCEGILCLPRRSAKGNSSGLHVACGSSSCVGCAAPRCGFGMWCQLAREPPSEWIATTGTSYLASKWTSEEKLIVSSFVSLVLFGIHWLITCHGGISPLPLSCITLYLPCVELVVVVASCVALLLSYN